MYIPTTAVTYSTAGTDAGTITYRVAGDTSTIAGPFATSSDSVWVSFSSSGAATERTTVTYPNSQGRRVQEYMASCYRVDSELTDSHLSPSTDYQAVIAGFYLGRKEEDWVVDPLLQRMSEWLTASKAKLMFTEDVHLAYRAMQLGFPTDTPMNVLKVLDLKPDCVPTDRHIELAFEYSKLSLTAKPISEETLTTVLSFGADVLRFARNGKVFTEDGSPDIQELQKLQKTHDKLDVAALKRWGISEYDWRGFLEPQGRKLFRCLSLLEHTGNLDFAGNLGNYIRRRVYQSVLDYCSLLYRRPYAHRVMAAWFPTVKKWGTSSCRVGPHGVVVSGFAVSNQELRKLSRYSTDSLVKLLPFIVRFKKILWPHVNAAQNPNYLTGFFDVLKNQTTPIPVAIKRQVARVLRETSIRLGLSRKDVSTNLTSLLYDQRKVFFAKALEDFVALKTPDILGTAKQVFTHCLEKYEEEELVVQANLVIEALQSVMVSVAQTYFPDQEIPNPVLLLAYRTPERYLVYIQKALRETTDPDEIKKLMVCYRNEARWLEMDVDSVVAEDDISVSSRFQYLDLGPITVDSEPFCCPRVLDLDQDDNEEPVYLSQLSVEVRGPYHKDLAVNHAERLLDGTRYRIETDTPYRSPWHVDGQDATETYLITVWGRKDLLAKLYRKWEDEDEESTPKASQEVLNEAGKILNGNVISKVVSNIGTPAKYYGSRDHLNLYFESISVRNGLRDFYDAKKIGN